MNKREYFLGDRNNAVYPGTGLYAAYHISFFRVHIFRFHGEKFLDAHSGVNHDKDNLYAAITRVLPEKVYFIPAECIVYFFMAGLVYKINIPDKVFVYIFLLSGKVKGLKRSVDKRVQCGAHCDTGQLHNEIVFSVWGKVARIGGGYRKRAT